MALTGQDETDLLLPLLTGAGEMPRYSTFLQRLMRRCDAVYAAIHIRTDPRGETVSYWGGPDLRMRAREDGSPDLNELDRIQYDQLRPGRVYASDEYYDADPMRRARRRDHMTRLGIANERAIRVLAGERMSAWMTIASDKSLGAVHSALLSSLSPYVAEVLRNLIAQEGDRLAVRMAEDGLARAAIGWIGFDSEGRVAALPPAVNAALAATLGQPLRIGERARGFGPLVERRLGEAVARFVRSADARPVPLVLVDDPRIEATLIPAGRSGDDALLAPAMVAILRWPPSSLRGSARAFADLHGIPLREAELALALCEGLSLAEAGAALGLTIETTRNYSKKLYGRLGLRGQAELVRFVMGSSAVFA